MLRRLLSAPEEGLQYRGSGRPRPISRWAALAGHASAALSTQPSTLSCLKWRSILISRSSRLQSIVSSNAFGIFLIATLFPVSVFEPEHTRPYAPCPTAFFTAKLGVTSKRMPQIL